MNNLITGMCLLFYFYQIFGNNIEPIYEWVNLEFDYPNETDRQDAIKGEKFIPGNPRVIDVDVGYIDVNKRVVFVTSPRFVTGVPVTLGIVTEKHYQGTAIIAPYPSWEWQNWEMCPNNRLVSVFNIKIDGFKRLWVLDTGSVMGQQKCRAQILAFDLRTNNVIHRYEIPPNLMESNSLLKNAVIDIRNTKTEQGTFVYITDTTGFSIIVYHVDRNQSWKVTDKTFYANPEFGTFCVPNAKFDLMDGILGAVLSPYAEGEDRVFYYHASASNTKQWVWTSFLRNRTAFLNSSSPNPEMFHAFCGRTDTHASVMAMDQRGVVYFGLGFHTSLNCWNTNYPYGHRNIRQLFKDPDIQYITGIKIVADNYGREDLWFANTRVKRIAEGPTNETIINFRVQRADLQHFYRECTRESNHMYTESDNCKPDPCRRACVNTVSS